MIAIVDYGVGNLGSIANMLKKVGVGAEITGDAAAVAKARGIIVPGVGNFDHCVRELRKSGLGAVLEDRARGAGVPLLGICVGMQMLARSSEEGTEEGLGWIPAAVKRFSLSADASLPIPHMGWAKVSPAGSTSLFEPKEQERFYFVHSFHMVCDEEADVAARADYGGPFVAAVQRGNILGTQFHPEKSHRFGMGLMRRFGALVQQAEQEQAR